MWRTAGARLWAVGLAATLASAAASTCVPPLGTARRVVTVARGVATGEAQRAGELGVPRDLQFHPLTGDLWVAAASADGRLNGNFIISKPGTAEQSTTLLRDRVAYHYMDNVSAFAFSSDGRALFTCQESLNEYMELSFPNYFQGPSAFEVYPCKGGYGRPPKSKCVGAQNAPNCNSDEECTIFTVRENGDECTGDGCFLIHSDMLHEAPHCMGVAYDTYAKTEPSKLFSPDLKAIHTWNRTRVEGNVVWYMDGLRGRLMRFDMDELHGTQVIDHRKANIRRYVDVHLTRREGVPGHMVVDSALEHLYISDTGAKRILRVKTTSGKFHRGAMCTEHQCYRHENHYWTCGTQRQDDRIRYENETACQSSSQCAATPNSCRRDIDNLCDPKDGGWCRYGQCKGSDGLGCYTTFTEMGYLFEYELWGATEYEVFSTEVKSPSGIALTPDGRLLVADYDTGDIYAFDKAGHKLARISTGSMGVTGLELECAGGGSAKDTACKLWLTNVVERTVSYILVDAPCVDNDVESLGSAPPLKQACTDDAEACKKDRDATTPSLELADRARPSFEGHNGATWEERMVIYHSYGKDCTKLPNAVTTLVGGACTAADCAAAGLAEADCVGTAACRVGARGCSMMSGADCAADKRWSDADAVQCPDRVDCKNMNLDLLVMAGYFCHPCLPNPCMNSGVCTNTAPRIGFTCKCEPDYDGASCELDKRVPACDALTASNGAYTPAALCGEPGAALAGQACTLQCASPNMVRVAVPRAVAAPAFALPPTQTDLTQRTCSADAAAKTSKWSGVAAACACRPRYFGANCTQFVATRWELSSTVGAAGGEVMSEDGGVKIPAGAMKEDAEVSVFVFTRQDLGEAGMPRVGEGFRAVSPVLELLPHGAHACSPAPLSLSLTPTLFLSVSLPSLPLPLPLPPPLALPPPRPRPPSPAAIPPPAPLRVCVLCVSVSHHCSPPRALAPLPPSLPSPSLPFPSLPFPPLPFPPLPFPSLPFPSLPIPSLPFPSLPSPPLPSPPLPYPGLSLPCLTLSLPPSLPCNGSYSRSR